MASIHVNLQHEEKEDKENIPVGFSWTVFFFGPFPPLFRGDLFWAVIFFFGGFGAVSLGPFALAFPLGIAFFYNQRFLDNQLDKGYKITKIEGGNIEDLKYWMNMSQREDLEEDVIRK